MRKRLLTHLTLQLTLCKHFTQHRHVQINFPFEMLEKYYSRYWKQVKTSDTFYWY